MPRISFIDILRNADIDISSEYKAVHSLFYDEHAEICSTSLYDLVNDNFMYLPIHDTCLTLSEFDNRFGFRFRTVSSSDDLDDLVLLIEYVLNFIMQVHEIPDAEYYLEEAAYTFIPKHIHSVCEKIHYEIVETKDGYILVADNPAAVEAAQVLPIENSYLPLQYSHHALQGDIQAKRNVLLNLSNELEPKRETLRKMDKDLENDLFFCLNSLNIRHNNISSLSSKYKKYIAEMSAADLEKWYDYTYNMILVALIKLGDYPSSTEMKQLKDKLT